MQGRAGALESGGGGGGGGLCVATAGVSRKGPLTVLVSHTCAAQIMKVVLLMATIAVHARPTGTEKKRGKYRREKRLLPF